MFHLPGLMIRKCQVPGTVAFTFDDGPWFYTSYVLEELAVYNAKATFFLTVEPNANINTKPEFWGPLVKKMHSDGHQIGLHGWAHENLNRLTDSERGESMEKTAKFYAQPEFLNGIRPTYIRPPFGECSIDTGCVQYFTQRGERIVLWDIDSDDWRNDSGDDVHITVELLLGKLNQSSHDEDSFLILMHDNRLQTGINSGFLFDNFIRAGYKLVTVGECIGDPKENWYVDMLNDSSFEEGKIIEAIQSLNTRGPGSTDFVMIWALAILALVSLLWALKTHGRIRMQQFEKKQHD